MKPETISGESWSNHTKFWKKAIPKNFGKSKENSCGRVFILLLQTYTQQFPYEKASVKDDYPNSYSVRYRRRI